MQKHRKECARYAIQLNSLRALLLLVRDTAIITSFRVASFFFSLTLLCQVCLFLTLSLSAIHALLWLASRMHKIQEWNHSRREDGKKRNWWRSISCNYRIYTDWSLQWLLFREKNFRREVFRSRIWIDNYTNQK